MVGAGVAAAMLFPPLAAGATLNGSTFSVNYTAGAGEANTLTIERVGGVYRFTDAAGVNITPTGTCAATANVGTCPVAQVNNLSASLGDMNDSGLLAASVDASLSSASIFGHTGNDTLTANAAVRNLVQLTADDPLAPQGNDTVTGGPGGDSLSAGGGNDTISGGPGDDNLSLEDGVDALAGGPGHDSFGSGPGPDGPDLVSGGPGEDRADLRNRKDDLLIDLDGVADDGGGCPGPACEGDNFVPDVEDVSTGEGDDTLIGSPGSEALETGGGDDISRGLAGLDFLGSSDGADRLEGGPGEDSFFGGAGPDLTFGGPGDDRIFGEFFDEDTDRSSGGGGFDLFSSGGEGNLEPFQVSLNGRADDGLRSSIFTLPKDNVLADIEDVMGSEANDVLIGSRRPNQLTGLGGRDRLVGLGGQDALVGARGRDFLAGGKGSDLLDGAGGPDILRARGGGSDELRCGSSLDRAKADRSDRFGPDCDKVSLPRRSR